MPLTPDIRKEIFNRLKTALEKHAPPMTVSKNNKTVFELIGNKPVPYGSRQIIVPGMYFCSAVARKDKISFYFFPMYFHEKEFSKTIPNMIRYLKGKTCFNFTKPDQIVGKELDAMIKKGVRAWHKSGYMK